MLKKIIIAIAITLFFVCRVQAQEIKIYLPVITKMGTTDNQWRIILPLATINRIENPSAETTGNFSALGGATVTRSTTYQKYGLYSYRVQTSGNNEGISLDIQGNLDNALYWATVRVRGTLPDSWDWSLDNSAYREPQLIEKIDQNWNLYGLAFPASEANGATIFYIRQNGSGSGDFYIDGAQVEQNTTWTTYCDGTQEGCAWRGAPHDTDSERSGQSRAGGKSVDFWDEYGFRIHKIVGAGVAPQNVGIDNYAILPGGELNSVKVQPRDFQIIGEFIADTEEELHTNRQALWEAFQTDDRQLTRIRFNGASVQKEIAVRYQGGLEGDLSAFYGDIEITQSESIFRTRFSEQASIQVVAPNPYWQEVGESAISLDTNDSATFRMVAGRLRSTGQWDMLGPPGAGGTYNTIDAFAEDDTYVYVGGNFTNFDGIASADYIVRWHKRNQSWSALGSGLNNEVIALAIAPNGDLYIGGLFTNAGGVAAADYLTRWDGSSYSAVGTPNTGAAAISYVTSLVFDYPGNLYIGGLFSNWADIANADNIVMWDGSSYSALSTGTNGEVNSLAINLNNLLYVGGDFTTPFTRITSWDGSAFADLDGGANSVVAALTVDSRNFLYATGGFTTIGGVSANRIALWNGTAFETLGDGLDGTIPAGNSLEIGPDDILYAGGLFDTAGGVDLTDRVARWNQYAWAHLDINMPGSAAIFAILASNPDPVVEQNYDLYIGGGQNIGTANYAGLVTTTNDGSVPTFPKIVYARSGGTSATLETLRNETTGKEILFNYSLLDGETLTIDLGPLEKTIISSFFGSRLDAVLPNSDFGIWSLPVGDSDVTSFIDVAGGPTIVAYMLWRDTYAGYD